MVSRRTGFGSDGSASNAPRNTPLRNTSSAHNSSVTVPGSSKAGTRPSAAWAWRSAGERPLPRRGVSQRLDAVFASNPGDGVPLEAAPDVARRFLVEHDPVHGGIGDAPKFPQPTILKFLWRTGQRTGHQKKRALGSKRIHLG